AKPLPGIRTSVSTPARINVNAENLRVRSDIATASFADAVNLWNPHPDRRRVTGVSGSWLDIRRCLRKCFPEDGRSASRRSVRTQRGTSRSEVPLRGSKRIVISPCPAAYLRLAPETH